MITFEFIFQLSEHYDNNNPLHVYMTLIALTAEEQTQI